MKKTVLASLAIIASTFCLFSQESQPSRNPDDGHRYLKEYWNRPEKYLEDQAWYMLDIADRVFTANPPSTQVSLEREVAFLMLDAVLHEPDPIHNPAVLDFLARRTQQVIEDLDKPLKDKKSLRVYKIYNCGLIFRTRDVTVAVDLSGRNGTLIPDGLMSKIVDKIDILFLTHDHGDHVDPHVRDLCHKRNVPIYATEEIFRQDDQVRHVRPENLWAFEVNLSSGKLVVNVLPGHQDKVQNNIWVVTLPNGKVICAMGDQWLTDGSDLAMIKEAGKLLPQIDVLAMDCWIHDFEEHLAALSPKLLISQHEDEIGAHGIDHREAFWMTLYKNDKIYHFDVPYVLMGWGEWYDCK